jgi:hypothetical protein
MSGPSALLADRMASLLPKTTAGACHPASPGTLWKSVCEGAYCCLEYRDYYTSCNGRRIYGNWYTYSCHY